MHKGNLLINNAMQVIFCFSHKIWVKCLIWDSLWIIEWLYYGMWTSCDWRNLQRWLNSWINELLYLDIALPHSTFDFYLHINIEPVTDIRNSLRHKINGASLKKCWTLINLNFKLNEVHFALKSENRRRLTSGLCA